MNIAQLMNNNINELMVYIRSKIKNLPVKKKRSFGRFKGQILSEKSKFLKRFIQLCIRISIVLTTIVLFVFSICRETGKLYHQRNYVANILFTNDVVQDSGFNGTTFNISGEVTICDNRSTINIDNCEFGIVFVDVDSCTWNEDGSITYSGKLRN